MAATVAAPSTSTNWTILVKLTRTLTLDGNLDNFIDEILAEVPEPDYWLAQLEVER